MEDENADRVYVPGTNATPPARDVEPFWPPEELETPVHGGKPVPHESRPTTPASTPPGRSGGAEQHGVYRPTERATEPPARPQPPAQQPPPPYVATPPPAGEPRVANGAWPHLPQHAEEPADADSPRPDAPTGKADTPTGIADSPWAQPPQRQPTEASPPAADDDVDMHRLGSPHRGRVGPSGTGTARPAASDPAPARRPADAPARRPHEAPARRPDEVSPPPGPGPGPGPGAAGDPGNGAVYRPGPRGAGDQRPPAAPRQRARPAASPPAGPPPTAPPPAAPPAAGPHSAGPPPADPYQPVDPYQQVPWNPGDTPTAEEFARRRLAKPAEPTATMGPRAMLQKSTLGLLRIAPGRRELDYKRDVEMVRRNFGGLRQVTVVNPKGGAGKTVAVLLLAMTFGQKRGGYVLAWDNNETQGTLGMRAQQDFHARTVRDMMRDLHLFRGAHGRVGDLSQYVRAQGEGMFDVLASDESATAGEMLTANAFAEIREIVSRFYKLIFVDTGNNVRAQNWQAAIDATDQLVITMSARNDSAETAARMLDHLEQSGRQRLVRQAISVVSMPPTRKDIDLPAIQRHFAARTRAVLLAPYEKLIDSGEPLRYGHLSGPTRDAWLKIAAAVAEGL
ncbi:chromosome partitioning protein [Mangrovihabitans endophyticus]|uniref:MinD-like ATPase involved in chromosome partitioning or flagellar assembly n=1 Tax=Mangrovihabitans endophyticus TaxID=1751298 RepID=A0A8J3C1W0_9ACTN|nr:chromosome partitioning protein [Mangrovihabitans endophyticus]GGK95302.1 hypothetical protein GCM10012284_31710 [Mangrovihabitans endophyticus]